MTTIRARNLWRLAVIVLCEPILGSGIMKTVSGGDGASPERYVRGQVLADGGAPVTRPTIILDRLITTVVWKEKTLQFGKYGRIQTIGGLAGEFTLDVPEDAGVDDLARDIAASGERPPDSIERRGVLFAVKDGDISELEQITTERAPRDVRLRIQPGLHTQCIIEDGSGAPLQDCDVGVLAVENGVLYRVNSKSAIGGDVMVGPVTAKSAMFEVVMSHAGKAPSCVSLDALSKLPRTVRLNAGCRVHGRVERRGGEAASGAALQLLLAMDKYAAIADRYEVHAGGSGEFHFEHVPVTEAVTILASDGIRGSVEVSTKSGLEGGDVDVGTIVLK
jgi:hypothetical protein